MIHLYSVTATDQVGGIHLMNLPFIPVSGMVLEPGNAPWILVVQGHPVVEISHVEDATEDADEANPQVDYYQVPLHPDSPDHWIQQYTLFTPLRISVVRTETPQG